MGLSLSEAVVLTGRTRVTLWRWKKSGIDITSETDLRAKMAEADLSAKGAAHTQSLGRLDSTGPVGAELGELPDVGEPGAAQALARLQRLEVQFAQRAEAALKTKNAKLIAAARADHGAVAESMRRYEKEIEESKRDFGHLIPRSDAADAVRMSLVWLRHTVRGFVSSYLPGLLAYNEPREASVYFWEKFTETLQYQLKNSADASTKLPDWAKEIITEEWRVEV